MRNEYDAYIQWIEYSRLANIQEMTSLRHGCTHMADLLELTADGPTRVALKRIADDQSFDFHQVNYFACKQCKYIINVLKLTIVEMIVFVYSNS